MIWLCNHHTVSLNHYNNLDRYSDRSLPLDIQSQLSLNLVFLHHRPSNISSPHLDSCLEPCNKKDNDAAYYLAYRFKYEIDGVHYGHSKDDIFLKSLSLNGLLTIIFNGCNGLLKVNTLRNIRPVIATFNLSQKDNPQQDITLPSAVLWDGNGKYGGWFLAKVILHSLNLMVFMGAPSLSVCPGRSCGS